MTIYKNTQDIKAHVKTDWSHKNHKFQPGSFAEVSAQVLPREYVKMDGGIGSGHSYVSNIKQRRVGRVGKVLAVSCTKSGNVRATYGQQGGNSRMFTRYYIQFRDGVIMGYESHHLKKAYSHRRSNA